MADVFISYKREERQTAERLSIALEQLGFDVWWDFELLSGDRFRKVIERVIDECKATVVLWSHLSRDSEFVIDEASYARSQDKLCPARIDDCRLPLGFGGDHVVDLAGWDGEMGHEGLQALLRSLETKVGKKARLGAKPRGQSDEERFREMEAFKAAEAAGNASALQSFLRDFPDGAFARFVRGQLETMAAETPKAAAHVGAVADPATEQPPSQTTATADRSARGAPPAPSGKKPGAVWPLFAGALALVAAVAVALAMLPRPQAPARAEASVDTSIDTAMNAAASATLPSQSADARALPASKSAAASAQPAQPNFVPFDLNALDAHVRAAVIQARAAVDRATVAAARGRQAAQQARDGAPLHYVGGNIVGYEFAGEMAYTTRAEGGAVALGVSTARDDHRQNPQRYEGEFGFPNSGGPADIGFGLMYNFDGSRHAGSFRANAQIGPGVYYAADGARYEGEFARGMYNGYGALWDLRGHLLSQGVWTDNQLTTPLGQ